MSGTLSATGSAPSPLGAQAPGQLEAHACEQTWNVLQCSRPAIAQLWESHTGAGSWRMAPELFREQEHELELNSLYLGLLCLAPAPT